MTNTDSQGTPVRSVRTATKRADKLEPGDRLMLLSMEVLVVDKVEAMVERGPVVVRDRGTLGQVPTFWMEITGRWERHPDGPPSSVVLHGERFVRLRDSE